MKCRVCTGFMVRTVNLETLREIGAAWIEPNKEHLENAIKEGILAEVSYDNTK